MTEQPTSSPTPHKFARRYFIRGGVRVERWDTFATEYVKGQDFDAAIAEIERLRRIAFGNGHQEFCRLGESGACTCILGAVTADHASEVQK
jgi:hypothetical protein